MNDKVCIACVYVYNLYRLMHEQLTIKFRSVTILPLERVDFLKSFVRSVKGETSRQPPITLGLRIPLIRLPLYT